MNIGVIVRTDQSGLAQQTMAVARHLDASTVVAVDMGHRSRGPQQEWSGAVTLCPAPVCPDESHAVRTNAAFSAFRHCDVVWTAETWYWPDLPTRLHKRGIRSVAHVNPELFRSNNHRHAKTVLPTTWHAERLRLPVVPHPAPVCDPTLAKFAAERLAVAQPARTFLHVAAPAVHDRNGTAAVIAAADIYAGPPIEIVIAGAGVSHLPDSLHGNVTVTRRPSVDNWQDLYLGIDVLIAPRRYGGQSLPALEATSAAIPVVMPAIEPQLGWSGVDSTLTVDTPKSASMKGGHFPVYGIDPRSVADTLHRYATDADHVATQAKAAHRWAESLRWDRVAPLWTEALG